MVRLQMNFRYSETCQIKMPNKEIKIHTYLSNHYNTMESSFPLYLWLWDKRIRRIGHVHFKFSSLQILIFLTKDVLKCRSKNDGDIFHHFWWILCKTKLSTIFKQANHSEMQWHASWSSVRPKPGFGYQEPKPRSNFGIGIGAEFLFRNRNFFFQNFSNFLMFFLLGGI